MNDFRRYGIDDQGMRLRQRRLLDLVGFFADSELRWTSPLELQLSPGCASAGGNPRRVHDEWWTGEENKLDAKKHRRHSGSQVLQKKRRRLLPFIPIEDPAQRLKPMGSPASALTAMNMEFSDDLTCMPGMAPRSSN